MLRNFYHSIYYYNMDRLLANSQSSFDYQVVASVLQYRITINFESLTVFRLISPLLRGPQGTLDHNGFGSQILVFPDPEYWAGYHCLG